jgi:hypothetical protein
MSRRDPSRIVLEQFRRQAKRWLRALRAGEPEAHERLRRALPALDRPPALRDIQHAIALEQGVSGWIELKRRLARESPIGSYERIAEAVVTAYATPDAEAIRVVWRYFGHRRAWPGMRRYIRLDLGRTEEPAAGEPDEVSIDEARQLVARAQGFESWTALVGWCESVPARKAGLAVREIGAFERFTDHERTGEFRSRDWDEMIDTIRARRLTAFGSFGQMTDELLERFTRLDSLTVLSLSDSAVTDRGLALLARMPQLERLDISGCGGISDDGLRVLRDLPSLTRLEARGIRITDAGAAHLSACRTLERVDLSGTGTGDGAIRALAGNEALWDSDCCVTSPSSGRGARARKRCRCFRRTRAPTSSRYAVRSRTPDSARCATSKDCSRSTSTAAVCRSPAVRSSICATCRTSPGSPSTRTTTRCRPSPRCRSCAS